MASSQGNNHGVAALIVGCNYSKLRGISTLHGCHNDAQTMHQLLTQRFGYDPKRIAIMTDHPNTPPHMMPTGKNIKHQLMKMMKESKPGDHLLFFFSGHGGMVEPRVKGRKRTPSILASDGNAITSLDFRFLVNRLHKQASFTIVADSCSSGGLIDKEPVQVGPPHVLVQEEEDQEDDVAEADDVNNKLVPFDVLLAQVSELSGLNDPDIGVHMLHLFGDDASLMFQALPADRRPTPLAPDQGILLSACEPSKKSYEVPDGNGKRHGAFTNFVSQTFMKKKVAGELSNLKLILMARTVLGKPAPGRPPQFPCLYCSKKNADAPFLSYKPAAGRVEEEDMEEDEATTPAAANE